MLNVVWKWQLLPARGKFVLYEIHDRWPVAMNTEEPERTDPRPALVEQLEEVIAETSERIESDLETAREIAHRLREDWATYRSSLQLRNRYAHGEPIDYGFTDQVMGLLRWVNEIERESRKEKYEARRRTRASGPVSLQRPSPPSDRIAQIRYVLEHSEGDPMDTGEITVALERHGWLQGVTDPRATVSAALSRGARLGMLERVSRGTYQLPSEERQEREAEGGDHGSSESTARKEEAD